MTEEEELNISDKAKYFILIGIICGVIGIFIGMQINNEYKVPSSVQLVNAWEHMMFNSSYPHPIISDYTSIGSAKAMYLMYGPASKALLARQLYFLCYGDYSKIEEENYDWSNIEIYW